MLFNMDVEINDIRSSKDFRGITFSKYQKSKVKAELLKSLDASKVESACYWAAELVCAGHMIDLWDCFIMYMSKDVHLGCPRLPVYLENRFNVFKEIITNGYVGQELRMRNDPRVRSLFSEIVGVLCYCKKKLAFTQVKIKTDDEFNMTTLASKLVAPRITYAEQVFKKEDPKELFIAANEFAYHVSDSKSAVQACYWFEWIMEFEKRCKKNKEMISCARRTFVAVQDKYQMEPIWLVWHIILSSTNDNKDLILQRILNALLSIYCIRFTPGVKSRRRYIIYFAISILTEHVNIAVPIINNERQIKNIVDKIDVVYQDVKKNEIRPATDYLSVHVKKSNLDKTIERLNKINDISNPPILDKANSRPTHDVSRESHDILHKTKNIIIS